MNSPTWQQGSPSWQQELCKIRITQVALMRLAPYRDAGLIPNPGTGERSILEAELRLGQALPPSYRAFLRQHDGWPRFFEGANLLSTRDLGTGNYRSLAEAALDAAESPLAPEPVAIAKRRSPLLPFGVDAQATTLFAFNPETRRADGEMEVVAWIGELGVAAHDFSDFLGLLVRLCQQELEDRGASAQLSPAGPSLSWARTA